MNEQIESILEIYDSLREATVAAGGIPSNLQVLKKMSVWELLCQLGPNNVRFHFENKGDKFIGAK